MEAWHSDPAEPASVAVSTYQGQQRSSDLTVRAPSPRLWTNDGRIKKGNRPVSRARVHRPKTEQSAFRSRSNNKDRARVIEDATGKEASYYNESIGLRVVADSPRKHTQGRAKQQREMPWSASTTVSPRTNSDTHSVTLLNPIASQGQVDQKQKYFHKPPTPTPMQQIQLYERQQALNSATCICPDEPSWFVFAGNKRKASSVPHTSRSGGRHTWTATGAGGLERVGTFTWKSMSSHFEMVGPLWEHLESHPSFVAKVLIVQGFLICMYVGGGVNLTTQCLMPLQ
jgi:hypothetical protein